MPQFTWDAMTSAVAREHSEDMAKYDYADYVSPRLGTLEYRLHRAGVSAGNARFAVYRMPSVAAVMENLRKSHLHLEAATDIGIGVATRGTAGTVRDAHPLRKVFPVGPVPDPADPGRGIPPLRPAGRRPPEALTRS